MKTLHLLLVLCGLLCQGASGLHAQTVQGTGATFPAKVYEKWMQTYASNTQATVGYKPTGSGEGIAKAKARQADFGGTDAPLNADELKKYKLVQIPMLVGGVVPVVNLPGIASNKLTLTGEVLADIMAGKVTRWNDTRITALNPGLALPARSIVRVVRADKSGTTHGFTSYLAAVSKPFKESVGVHQLPKWPGDVKTGEGNDGAVQVLRANEGAISYVSFDRVQHDALAAVRLRNAAGNVVAASEEGFRAAISDSGVAREGNDLASLVDRPSPQAWPITLTSFVLVDQEPANVAQASATLRYLYWCFMHGDELTRGTGFAPLPVSLQARLAARFASVRSVNGALPQYAGL